MTTQEFAGSAGPDAGAATDVDGAANGAVTDATAGAATEAAAGAAPLAAALAGRTTYPLAPGYRVNVRQGAGTNTALVRQLPAGAQVQIRCQTRGQWVAGPYGSSNIWDNIAPGEYISDTYVHTGSDGMVAPSCMS
ncbi:SH3 domain-containing protein [Streptomyces noursei]|uniref:SH3 domain-containing protein n=1 Tax=Streptomyces noursei TaxID=1971 RepID=UPI003B8A669A